MNGNVYYRLIEMNSGAMVNGQLVYNGDGAMEAITHDKPSSADDDSETLEIPATSASSA